MPRGSAHRHIMRPSLESTLSISPTPTVAPNTIDELTTTHHVDESTDEPVIDDDKPTLEI